MDRRHPLRVVTPTLDGDVLAQLAMADVAFSPGQLRQLLPHASVGGVRKVLNRLAEQGIVVTASGGGSTVMYRLNRDHLSAGAIIALATAPASLRDRARGALANWADKPRYAVIFGSWARGAARADSDIDLFMVREDRSEDDVWNRQLADFGELVSRWTGNDARLMTVSVSELEGVAGDPVMASIRDEGLTLWGEASWFRGQIKKHATARWKSR